MICNEIYKGQGLGNQLWNYILTRILAKQKKCDFSVLGRELFKGEEFMDLDFGIKLQSGESPEGGPPHKLPNGIKNYYKEKIEFLKGSNINISRTDKKLLKIPLNTKFDGNCQSTKYLKGYKKDILNWIKIKDNYKKYKTDSNTCIIHIRCGDYTNLKDVFLPKSYYENAIKYLKKMDADIKFLCVTDQKNIARKILPDIEITGSSKLNKNDSKIAPHHFGGSVGVDFSLLMNAKYLIIPNSSFSWWAAYLNNNKQIVIAPKYWARYNISNGYWSTSDIITDDFTYLDRKGNFQTARECWTEKNNYEMENKKIFCSKRSVNLTKKLKKESLSLLKKYIPKSVKKIIKSYLR